MSEAMVQERGPKRGLSPMIPAIVQAELERFDGEIQQRLEIGAGYKARLDQAGIRRVRQHRTSELVIVFVS